MPTNPSAFGPLSAGTKQAAGLVGKTRGGGFNLSRLSGRPSFGGEPQDAEQDTTPIGLATGAGAPIEEFQPLLPEGEATGERGDITQLPGFQAATEEGGLAEVPGEEGPALPRLSAGGATNDAAKALRSTSQALKLSNSAGRLGKDFGLLGGGASLSLSPSSVSGLGPGASSTGFAPLTPKGLGEATAGATSGASGLGTVTAGGAGLSAILGLLATLTGDENLGLAAKGAGIGTGLLGLANTGAGLAATGGTLAAGGAAAGGAGAAGATLGGAAGAGFAPVAAGLIATEIANLIKPGSMPSLSDALQSRSITGDYHRFLPDLGANQTQQGQGFEVLAQGLPYVKTKEELGQLLNSYKNYVSTTAGLPLEDRSGTGDPYRLSAISGTGPVTHGEQTPTIDWGPQEQMLQGVVDLLAERLPGNRITAGYGQPGGGLEGEPARRLAGQFLQPDANNLPGTGQSGWSGPVYGGEGQAYQNFSPEALANAQEAGTFSRQPTWDPATGEMVLTTPGGAGPPKAADYFQKSDLWQQLTGGGAAPGAMAADPNAPSDLGGLQRLIGKAQPQAGALSPGVPSEFAAAAKNPDLLKSLLSNPGLLARLFAPQGGA